MYDRKGGEAGYLLLDTIALGLIVLAAAAVLGLFARTALLDAEGTARTGAALLAREELSVMVAELDDTGTLSSRMTVIPRDDMVYTVDAVCVRQSEPFYDVSLHISWSVWGRVQTAEFMRRMRVHDTVGG